MISLHWDPVWMVDAWDWKVGTTVPDESVLYANVQAYEPVGYEMQQLVESELSVHDLQTDAAVAVTAVVAARMSAAMFAETALSLPFEVSRRMDVSGAIVVPQKHAAAVLVAAEMVAGSVVLAAAVAAIDCPTRRPQVRFEIAVAPAATVAAMLAEKRARWRPHSDWERSDADALSSPKKASGSADDTRPRH